MIKTLLFALVFPTVAHAADARDEVLALLDEGAAAPQLAEVLALLDEGAGVPLFAEAFKAAAGDRAPGLLVEIAQDPKMHARTRLEAMTALAAFKSAPAKNALMTLLHDPMAPVRKSAVTALARDYKGSPEVLEGLARALDDGEAVVRKAAVRALGLWPEPSARGLLFERAHVEKQPSVRELIAKTLN